MAQQTIDIGSVANDGTGTPLREAFRMINENDTELYAALADKAPKASPEFTGTPSAPTATATTNTTQVATTAMVQSAIVDRILGTVSQSSGVPTGKIVETGSNGNGRYVRFADGTQICWWSGTRTDIALTAYGSLFEGDFTVTFPKEFSAAPVATLSSCYPVGNRAWGGSVVSSTTGATFSAFDVSARSLGTTFVVSYMAIGRWF